MPSRLTTDEWVEKAKILHGDRYDYSKSVYKGRTANITIICPVCGPIEVHAGFHVTKTPARKPTGCNTCNRNRAAKSLTKSFDEMVSDARAVHGDRYEYIEDTYVSARVQMKMICPSHGEVTMIPDSHINKQAICKECGKRVKSRRTLHERALKSAARITELSQNAVTLQIASYVGQNFDCEMRCKKHGFFIRKPILAMQTRHPCPSCMRELPKDNSQISAEEIRKRLMTLKGDFEVIDVMGEGKKARIEILCTAQKPHGRFTLNLDNLYGRTFACGKCSLRAAQSKRNAGLKRAHDKSKATRFEKWKSLADDFHGGRYDYKYVEYNDMHSKVAIECRYHGIFYQTPSSHLSGGCRLCADEELKGRYTYTYFSRHPDEKEKPALLYYVELAALNKTFLKVGITTTSLKTRFGVFIGQKNTVQELASRETTLFQAFEAEQNLLTNCQSELSVQLSEYEQDYFREARVGITELLPRPLTPKEIKRYFECP